jgi:hypothetical protein
MSGYWAIEKHTHLTKGSVRQTLDLVVVVVVSSGGHTLPGAGSHSPQSLRTRPAATDLNFSTQVVCLSFLFHESQLMPRPWPSDRNGRSLLEDTHTFQRRSEGAQEGTGVRGDSPLAHPASTWQCQGVPTLGIFVRYRQVPLA